MYYSTAEEMAELDRIAVDRRLPIQTMMDHAGKLMPTLIKLLDYEAQTPLTIVCGKGNNGGNGTAAAFYLKEQGYRPKLVMLSSKITPESTHFLKLAVEKSVPVVYFEEDKETSDEWIADAEVVIDAMIGYRLEGAPKGVYAEAVNMINDSDADVISFDTPTGVHIDTGEPLSPSVQAETTLTLALPKKLFETKAGKKASGNVYIGDLSIPEAVYNEISPDSRPAFKENGLLEL